MRLQIPNDSGKLEYNCYRTIKASIRRIGVTLQLERTLRGGAWGGGVWGRKYANRWSRSKGRGKKRKET